MKNRIDEEFERELERMYKLLEEDEPLVDENGAELQKEN